MFEVHVNLDGVLHKVDTLASSAKDLEKPLAIFGGYMKKKALRKYEAQSFTPLAESTLEKRASAGLHVMKRKLYSDLRKARRRVGGGAKGIIANLAAEASRGVRNRKLVLETFLHRHGFEEAAQLRELSLKQAASLDERTQRQIDRTVSKPILGGLPRTLTVSANAGSMTLKSKTHEKWSAAHNEGSTVGNGAKLPERKTLEVESQDLEVLASILKSYLLLPFQEGLHGPGF